MNTKRSTAQHETPPQQQPEYLSIPEGAALCRVSPWTFRQWLTRGKLRRYHAVGRTLVNKAEVLALIQPEG